MRAPNPIQPFAAALVSLALLACGNPPVVPSADRADSGLTTTISGQVVFQGQARGDAVVFLYDAAHPPPPLGTAHPLAFTKVPADKLFSGALHDVSQPGPFAAAYTFPTVAPGNYLVIGFLDSDACIATPGPDCALGDFGPFYIVTREPNGGDLLGGHVDADGVPAPVVVPEPDTRGLLAPVAGVQVGIGATPLPDRPAFSVAVDPAQVPLDANGNATVNPAEPTFFALRAAPISQPAVAEAQPAFLLRYVDDDHDGVPDLSPLGVPALWPKVFVRKIAEPQATSSSPLVAAGLRDENDLDDDGILDARGQSYDHLALSDGGPPQRIPADAAPDLVLLPTAFVADPITSPQTALLPSQLYAQLAGADGGADVNKVVPLTELKLALLPQAVDASAGAPVPLAAMPPGRYAVIVEQYTGQSWRVPNELSGAVAPALGFGAVDSQSFTFTVAP